MRIDLHVHTIYSRDALINPRMLPRLAKKAGLHGVAITDHDTLEAHRLLPREGDILIIPGVEVHTEEGGIIGLFISETLKTVKLDEAMDEIKGQGGLVVLPHPYGFPRVRSLRLDALRKETLDRIDAVEALNGRQLFRRQTVRAFRLAQALGKPVTGGSDAHFSFEVGNAYTIFPNASTVEDVVRGLRRGETKVGGRATVPFVHLLTLTTKLLRRFL